MRVRKIVIVCLLLAFAATYLVGRKIQRQAGLQAGHNTDRTVKEANKTGDGAVRSDGDANGVQNRPIPVTDTDGTLVRQIQTLQRAAELQRVPINFWGRVVDEKNNPVPDVSIEVKVRKAQVLGFQRISAFDTNELRTDTSGAFSIIDARGDLLMVKSLQKEGYLHAPGALRSFGYNISTNHVPDQNSPVIFRMWKKGMPQPLVTFHTSFRIPVDSTAIGIDVLQGRIGGNSADLKISIVRASGTPELNSRRFDWSVDIQAVDGGIIETSEDMLRAPETGYQESLHFMNPSSDQGWRASRRVLVCFTSRGGQCFGRAVLDFIVPASGQAAVILDSTTNPQGSRNLEPGGAQVAAHAQWAERLTREQQ